jgi:hypothetical protein
MEVPEVRRRLRIAIESARRLAQERRARSDQATRDYELFLRERAVPLFHTAAAALVAEGHRFKVFTPAESVRLASESSADDFIELALDTSFDPPVVIGHTSRGRGRRLIATEQPLKEGTPVDQLTEEDILDFLVRELAPFVER